MNSDDNLTPRPQPAYEQILRLRRLKPALLSLGLLQTSRKVTRDAKLVAVKAITPARKISSTVTVACFERLI